MNKDMKQEELLEQLVEHGIAALAEYIEERVQRKIVIVDSYGYMHYPERSEFAKAEVLELFSDVEPFEENRYYYRKIEQSLLYPVGSRGLRGIILVKHVSEDQINHVLTVLNSVKSVLKMYVHYEKRMYEKLDQFSEDMIHHIFIKPAMNIKLILEKAGIELDMDREYAVLLIRIGEDEKSRINEHVLWSDIAVHAKKWKISFIPPIPWNGVYVSFLSGRYDKDTLAIKKDWLTTDLSEIWKRGFEERYGVKVGIAIGQPHQLKELHKSYNEARVAMYFHLLKKEHSFVDRFCDLGVFSMLFSQEPDLLKNYCMRVINRLLEYDHNYEGDLCLTLRTLLENNFNWKAVAETLFVHVNTLRYRYEKIEQILNVDLSKVEVRTDLFVALRTADILKEMGYLQPVFIGNTMETGKVNNNNKQSKTLW